jgi:hypothetical protein
VGECARACPSPPAAGRHLNDVYRFSPAANAWTALFPSGSGPFGRYGMGFAATPDGMLYVFGGYNSGTERAGHWLFYTGKRDGARRCRSWPCVCNVCISSVT